VASNILIIVPRFAAYRSVYEFPLGLAYISSCLKCKDMDTDILNLNQGNVNVVELITNKLQTGKYKYVLTGGLSAHYKQIKTILDTVRSIDPNIKIIVGGGIITSTPELMYRYLLPDYIVLGEGELTIVELINELENGKKVNYINGIGYNLNNELIITKPRAPILELDSIPWPDFQGFEISTYLEAQSPNDILYSYVDDNSRLFPMISSRGCIYNCTFCFHPLGQKYRSRSVSNFVAEVKYISETYNVKGLAILDELLSADKVRLYEICNRLKELPYKLYWMCQLRVDSVDAEMLQIMKEAGCYLISYGFESASDRILKSMRKNITKDQIRNALKLTREAGIGIQGYFIFGDTMETKETAYETLAFWEEHKDYHITLGCIRPYPGSILWDKAITKYDLNTDSKQLDFLDKCINDPPNLSCLNDQEWSELRKDIQRVLLLNNHFGSLISSKKVAEKVYEIKVRCPHCNTDIIYNNFKQRILGIFKLTCRSCNQSFNMSPLAFGHVSDDYFRNIKVYNKLKEGTVSVIVTPCMNIGEFIAMKEIALQGVNIQGFMDIDDDKVGTLYSDSIIKKRDQDNVNKLAPDTYFLIPLTRFADKIFNHLISLGINIENICRLDEIIVGPTL